MKIIYSIVYAGLQLPVLKNEQGKDVTPLKPIAELFGLSWTDQHKKLSGSAYLREHLGICMGDIPHAGSQKVAKSNVCTPLMGGADSQKREQICILVSRVAAYLMTISPDRVRAQGNIDGAKFLMEKQEEWADALHDYEEIGVAINMKHIKQQEQLRKTRMALVSVIGVKNKTADAADRKAVTAVIAQMTAELGLPYQPDLLG